MDVEKGNLCALLLGLYIGPATGGNSMEDLQLKIEAPHDSHNVIQKFHFWGLYTKKTKKLTGKDICTPMFIAALFTTAKTQKPTKRLLMDKQIKVCSIDIYNRKLAPKVRKSYHF